MNEMERSELRISRRRLLVAGGALIIGALARERNAMAAADGASGAMHEHHQHQHQHMQMTEDIKRTEATYTIPGVTLVRQDGAKVAFPAQLDDGRPVILDFIYTSCTAVCPITSQVFSQFQDKLGADRDKVKMISISIDPEYDTPKRLAQYAKKFHAAEQWQHYTGTAQDSIAMQRAFNVYRGDKMNHVPVTFLRAAPGKPWVRLEGFATSDMLVREYHDLVKKS